jgi:hypothetical protein
MTALPPRLKRLISCELAKPRLRVGSGWRVVSIFLLTLLAGMLVPAWAVRAQDPIKGEVKPVTDGGYVRLMFQFDEAVEASTRVSGPIIVISFNKPVAVAVERLNVNAAEYISAARRDPDGSAIRIALTRKVKLNTIGAAERLYVDLMPENWKGPMPGLPQEVVDDLVRRAREAKRQLHQQRAAEKQKKPVLVRVKVATQPTFVRYIFTMPGTVNVVPERADGRVTLNFDQQVNWDLADAKASLPQTLKSIEAEIDFDSVAVVFALNGAPDVRTFSEDRSIVVDIGLDGARPKPTGQEGSVKPAISDRAPKVATPETSSPKSQIAESPSSKAVAPRAEIVAPPASSTSTQPSKDAEPQPALAVARPAPQQPAAPSAPAAAPADATPRTLPDAAPAGVLGKGTDAPAASGPPSKARGESAALQSTETDSLRPKANPNAVVVVAASQSEDNVRLEFPFAVPTPAAVFQRADVLWLVFDTLAQIDLAALGADDSSGVREVLFERADDGAAVVRIKLARARMASLESDGPGWIVKISDTAAPTRPLGIARSLVGKNRASLAIPFEGPRAIHNMRDPDIGDRLIIVTALGPARGFLKVQEFVELLVLPSTHGVSIQPIADDVTAELSADKITIGRPAGLSLSATALGQQQVAVNFRAFTFDTQVWGFDRDAPFNARQSELIGLAASAPVSRRRHARFNLARFYLARDMAPEAKAVLSVAQADQRNSDDITGSVLTAVANVMLARTMH